MTTTTDALPVAVFLPDGPDRPDGPHRVVPTALARGPWSPHHQHGGAPAALLARAVERTEPLTAARVVRMTIDLVRPVPLTPLDIVSRISRPGKRVQVVEAALVADGVEVAWCRALRLREAELDLPEPERQLPLELCGPEAGKPMPLFPGREIGFWRAIEARLVRGDWMTSGPGTVWFRLQVPVVAGETPSPLQRVAVAADFGNGVSAAVPRDQYSFINPDLNVFLLRAPVGEWIALDAVSSVERAGVGVAEAGLYDEEGRIGHSVQALLIDRM